MFQPKCRSNTHEAQLLAMGSSEDTLHLDEAARRDAGDATLIERAPTRRLAS